eukprot:scaffold85949_cov33-Tisochrysis_lutea.AAC.1
MAAPKAAASSGRDERRTDRPRAFETTSTTASMRAAPPTNKTCAWRAVRGQGGTHAAAHEWTDQ